MRRVATAVISCLGFYVWLPIAFITWIIYRIRVYIHRNQLINTGVSNKSIFITGCDTGFGYLGTLKCAKEGFMVFAGCLTETGINRLNDAAQQHGLESRIIPLRLDVTKSDNIGEAKQFIETNLNGTEFWAVINNAGISGLVVESSILNVNDYKKAMAVNFFGIVDVTLTFMDMIKKSRGRFVMTASLAGFVGFPSMSPYCSSKFAVVGFTESLRKELYIHGISVSVIVPELYPTDIVLAETHRKNLQERLNSLPQWKKDQFPENYFKNRESITETLAKSQFENDPMDVVNMYFHAVSAKYPYPTYWVGYEAAYLYRLLAHSSEEMQTWLMQRAADAAKKSVEAK